MTKSMRALSLTVFAAIAISAAFILAGAPAFAAVAGEKRIDALDEVYFDGSTLKIAYTLQSRCRTAEHDSSIKLVALKASAKNTKLINGFNVNVYDIADEANCANRLTTVLVSNSINLAQTVDAEITVLTRKGFKVDADYTLNLP